MQEELRRELARFHDLTGRMPSAALHIPASDEAQLAQTLSGLIDERHPRLDFPDGVSVYCVVAAMVFDLEALGRTDGVGALLAQYRQRTATAH